MIYTKIIICSECKGSGKIQIREIEDYHNNIDKVSEVICNSCDGYGRVKETTTIKISKLSCGYCFIKEKIVKKRRKT